MRKHLAVTLALVVALAGFPLAGRTHGSSLKQTHVDAASAAAWPRALISQSVVRTGASITRLVSPTITVPVPGYADIFLAGRAFPFTIAGPYGTDVAGRQQPPSVKIAVSAGHAISVLGKFATADGFSIPLAPDATGYTKRIVLAGPAERGVRGKVGFSSLRAPIDGLVGVFTGAKPNKGKTPPTLDFSTARARDAATLKPRLYQVFFIGTGLTSKGAVKGFIVPKGATDLYLGSLDRAGSNHDNHGVILAFVTGTRLIVVRTAPAPVRTSTSTSTPVRGIATATRTPRPGKPGGSPTTIPVIGMVLSTDTVTGTPTPTPTLVLPSGFQYNAQGQIVNTLGTPVALNPQGTPINSQGTPVNNQGTPVNVQGTPVNVQGTPVNQQGTAVPTNTPVPAATNTPVPTATGAATGTATVSATPSAPPPGTPIVQSVNEAWSQYQFDYRHNGYQALDTANAQNGIAPDLDPNADPTSGFYAGRLHLQTVSPAINGDVSVAGGPVLGLNGLYYTSGQDAALRCDWANGSPADGFACPAGFDRISFGSNFEDNVPVINPGGSSQNIIYYLSHNNPTGRTIGTQTGSLTAYNANTGGRVATYTGNVALPTAPGVALTVYNTTCYVPTDDPGATQFLHFLKCGPNDDGTDRGGPYPLAGIPLAGAAVDTVQNLVLVAVQVGNGGKLEAFDDAESTTPGHLVWSVNLPGSGATYTPFQPIVLNSAGLNEVVVATNYGIGAYNLVNGSQIWARTASTTATTVGPGATCATTGTDLVPAGYTVSFNAEDTPAYDPFPTRSDVASVYVGLPVNSGGTPIANELVRLNALNGIVCAVGTGAPSATNIPISGAPVTDTGAPNSAFTATGRDVVFYADNNGAVYALDASALTPLITATTNHALPDAARPGIPGLVPNASPPIGASLIVANGHLYFGTSNGSIFNYSF